MSANQTNPPSFADRLALYLRRQMSEARRLTVEGLTRIPGGASRETWSFDACWSTDTGDHRQGFILRRDPDAGLLETRSFCGTLLMELVDGEVDDAKAAVASALLDVRSLKLDYRTEYRGMLRRLSEEMVGLVADVRSSAKGKTCVMKTAATRLPGSIQ